ncbi:MAG: heavy-metal-associated domain-containing protein [Chloroflexota bacterium]
MQSKRFEMPALFGDHHVVEVRRILLQLPGVSEVYASSAFQVVEVTYDEAKINDIQLAVKLDEAGYLGEWAVPAEMGAESHTDAAGTAPLFRHTAVYETTKKTVAFAHQVSYRGRPLWHCPGMGTIRASDEEPEHA